LTPFQTLSQRNKWPSRSIKAFKLYDIVGIDKFELIPMAFDEERRRIYVKGFPSLSDFIASDFDHSSAIFKRFDRLSARNLLYLQCELAELEVLQDQYDHEDLAASLEEKSSLRDWKTFQTRANDAGISRERMRMELSMRIREKLKEYSIVKRSPLLSCHWRGVEETLLLESAFLAMTPPSKQAYDAFYKYFWNEDNQKGRFPTLLGSSSSLYDNRHDLVSIRMEAEEDRLTTLLRNRTPQLFVVSDTLGESWLA
jgi:hypothetical protein